MFLRKTLSKYTTNSNEAHPAADFVANFVYEDGVPAWVIYDEGRVVFDVKGGVFAEAFLKDHLGNVRVAIRRSSGQTTIRQIDSHTEHVP